MADVDDGRAPFETVRAVMTDPEAGTDRLPSLLRLLDDDDETVRLAGAFALCLVTVADPDSAPYVVERLSDRLEAGTAEVRVAVEYIVRRFPDRVDDELVADSAPTPEGRGPAGGEPADDAGVEDVGRVRPPRAGFDPRNVDPNRSVIDPADPQRHDDPAQGPSGESSVPDGTVPEERDSSETNIAERRQWTQLFERLTEIVDYSRFEELMMLSGQRRGRFADVARVLTVDEGVERALAMRLFYQPSSDNRDSLLADLATALDRWQAVSDHPGIATVYDWNRAPQPWAATDLIETTVTDRIEALAPPRAVSVAIDVADALAYAHNHGVVHGGLDPRNIGLPSPGEDEAEDTTATLVNVGLLEVYRYHVSPASCLDPRYAAPEYYDRQFGQVDHATDVYHLGAVLYRLLTGRPPFLGEFEAIREDVLNAAPPQPSLQVDVPEALDSVVSKAMAKRSLGRYETINDLRQDLTRVHDELTEHDESRGSDHP